jgi:hypothetical protein
MATLAEGLTAQDAPNSKSHAFDCAMGFYRLNRILGT